MKAFITRLLLGIFQKENKIYKTADIYLHKVGDRKTRNICEICSIKHYNDVNDAVLV